MCARACVFICMYMHVYVYLSICQYHQYVCMYEYIDVRACMYTCVYAGGVYT